MIVGYKSPTLAIADHHDRWIIHHPCLLTMIHQPQFSIINHPDPQGLSGSTTGYFLRYTWVPQRVPHWALGSTAFVRCARPGALSVAKGGRVVVALGSSWSGREVSRFESVLNPEHVLPLRGTNYPTNQGNRFRWGAGVKMIVKWAWPQPWCLRKIFIFGSRECPKKLICAWEVIVIHTGSPSLRSVGSWPGSCWTTEIWAMKGRVLQGGLP